MVMGQFPQQPGALKREASPLYCSRSYPCACRRYSVQLWEQSCIMLIWMGTFVSRLCISGLKLSDLHRIVDCMNFTKIMEFWLQVSAVSLTWSCSRRLHCGKFYCQPVIRVFLFDQFANRERLNIYIIFCKMFYLRLSLIDCTMCTHTLCVIWGFKMCSSRHYKKAFSKHCNVDQTLLLENHISVWL